MSDTRKKMLPVGIENFENIRKENFYYIDKTMLIKDLLYDRGQVNLFTRPRRFGKSLNMSMLKYFFEIGCDPLLFNGLAISEEKNLCEEYMGKFPVIAITLKGVQADSFDTAQQMMKLTISEEARRLLRRINFQQLNVYHQEIFTRLCQTEISESDLMNALRLMAEILCEYYNHPVIILIDEYDVPLSKASEYGYYESMVSLMRNMFEQALKTNPFLHFAVLTGCLRIARESIFTGMNNLRVLSMTDMQFNTAFGFTDSEVKNLLSYYDCETSYQAVRDWYDGYRFGNADVYCPWDVICYCDKLRYDPTLPPQDYWSNTSSNYIVRQFISNARNVTLRREIEQLIAGEEVVKEIHQELTYKDLYNSADHLWSVLFTTGYLTQRGRIGTDSYRLVIPNMEIRRIFTRQIMELFKENVREDGKALDHFCSAFSQGNGTEVQKLFEEYLKKTISIRDTFVHRPTKKNFYHGILLGLLGFKENWGISSNRETGDGYGDILIEIDDENIGIIIEVKYAHNGNLEKCCQEALEQIEEQNYEQQFLEDGIKKVLKYGIACYKKKCQVAVII